MMCKASSCQACQASKASNFKLQAWIPSHPSTTCRTARSAPAPDRQRHTIATCLESPFFAPSLGRHGLHILRNPTSVHGNEFRPASSILSILHSSNCIILVSCSFRASVSLHPVAAEVGSAGHRIDRHIHTIEYMNLARTTVDSTLEVH